MSGTGGAVFSFALGDLIGEDWEAPVDRGDACKCFGDLDRGLRGIPSFLPGDLGERDLCFGLGDLEACEDPLDLGFDDGGDFVRYCCDCCFDCCSSASNETMESPSATWEIRFLMKFPNKESSAELDCGLTLGFELPASAAMKPRKLSFCSDLNGSPPLSTIMPTKPKSATMLTRAEQIVSIPSRHLYPTTPLYLPMQ